MIVIKQLNKCLVFAFLAIFIVLSVSFSASCENATCSITVNLQDSNKNPVENVSVGFCKIADLNGYTYNLTSNFANSGLELAAILNSPDADISCDVEKYIFDNNISFDKFVSKEEGLVSTSLEAGVWLVLSLRDGEYSFAPYFINLTNVHMNKHYSTTPKLEQNKNTININVRKIWDDNDNSSKHRPSEITVNLLADNKVILTVELNAQNGWQYTFEDCQKNKIYSVNEEIVKNYTATYGGDAQNGFIITNTLSGEKLPQTGQLWWPAVILSVVGICFIVLGVVESKVKKNVKE